MVTGQIRNGRNGSTAELTIALQHVLSMPLRNSIQEEVSTVFLQFFISDLCDEKRPNLSDERPGVITNEKKKNKGSTKEFSKGQI
jgi:hypothetical protein